MKILKHLHSKANTVAASVSGRPREAEKVSVTGP